MAVSRVRSAWFDDHSSHRHITAGQLGAR
jgi:hypothetical protein